MSYLPNGSTLRATFREMPPKRHNLTLEKSELLAYIVETIGGGVAEANRAFNSMRNVKSQVLVFDRIERVWHGCDWKPSDEAAQKDLESRKLSDIRREIAQLWKAINALRKARQRGRRNQKQEKANEQPTEDKPTEPDRPSLSEEFAKLFPELADK
jgi:hypothetical protein